MRRRYGLSLLLLACSPANDSARETPADRRPVAVSRELVLASTTSTEDSGLFDFLLPAFERAQPGLRVHLIAVGTGQALELGRRRDADVLLVHAPAAESAFVAQGHAVRRCAVMHNRFLIVGPDATVAQGASAVAAMRRIARERLEFVSRGDDSGTHKKEQELWKRAGVTPAGSWYLEAGQGMGEVLTIANEKRAYTLTDEATYLFMRNRLSLVTVVENDSLLFNPYSVITVRDARNATDAAAFADWITSGTGRSLIAAYGVDRFGRALFIPETSTCG